MGDTKTYKYVSNKDGADATEEIRLPGKDPVRVGGEVELTEAEHDLLSNTLNLRAVSADKQGEAKSEDATADESSSAK